MKEAVVNAQKTCDKMVAEAEAKCAKMLGDASSLATTNTQTSETQMAAENARVEEARRVAAAKINELQDQLRSCIQALDRIKQYELHMTEVHWAEHQQFVGARVDVSRFGAQVINGIGFLGAGTIIVTGKQQVKGLTREISGCSFCSIS